MSTSELPRIEFPARSTDSPSISRGIEHLRNGSPAWTTDAPKKVIRHFASGDEQQVWRAWKKHLARRRSPWSGTRLSESDPAEIIQWGLSGEQLDDETCAAISALFEHCSPTSEARQRALLAVLSDESNNLDEQAALLHLACAYALPGLAASIVEPLWWELLGVLCRTARDAEALALPEWPLLHQWLAGELSLVMATLFPELSACAELGSAGRRALSVGFDELLDGEGMPHCRYLDIQWPLVACWTRVRAMSRLRNEPCCDAEAEAQYPFTVREMLRLVDYRGSSLFALSPAADRKTGAHFFAAAVAISGDKENRTLLRSLNWHRNAKTKGRARKKLPGTANHSEWAGVAVLRSTWEQSSPHLGIAYNQPVMRGDLAVGCDRVITGEWPFIVTVDGQHVAPVGDWESNCWVSDDDVDYLELEIALREGLKLQRQMCLARKDQFLFIADAVLGTEPRSLRHSIRLPLGGDVKVIADDETREIRLGAQRTKAMVFPLSLPEWRIERRIGDLSADGDSLELQHCTKAQSLYAPLWIDLDTDRQRKPFTWRQLTVAEERRVVPRDAAVGYRVQFGKKQWLVYRSLTSPRNRTVLGHNLATDFLIARFGRDGSVTTLIEVE